MTDFIVVVAPATQFNIGTLNQAPANVIGPYSLWIAASGTFNVAASDRGTLWDNTGTYVINLPAVATVGVGFTVGFRTVSGTQTITSNGAEVINSGLLSATTLAISQAGTIWQLTATSTAWVAAQLQGDTLNLPGTTSAASATTGTFKVGNGIAATSAAIGGGNINAGSAITAGTTLTSVGNTAVGGNIQINNSAATSADMQWQRTSVVRWLLRMNSDTESGGDAGSTLFLNARADAGGSIDNPITFVRAAGGLITLTRPLSITSSTEASAVGAASVILAGGLGIAKRLYAGTIGSIFKGNLLAGVQDGTAAVAGQVGEPLSSTVSGVAAAATTVTGNVTSVSVTAGQWKPTAILVISAGATGLTSGSTIKVSIVSTTATDGTSGSTMIQESALALLANGLFTATITIPAINISATTTYYLTTNITYAAGSPTLAGSLMFDRMR